MKLFLVVAYAIVFSCTLLAGGCDMTSDQAKSNSPKPAADLLQSYPRKENITTISGDIYNSAEVIKILPNGIVIQYVVPGIGDEVKLIKFSDLPENIRNKYGYKPSSPDVKPPQPIELKEEDITRNKQRDFLRREDEKSKKFEESLKKVMNSRTALTFKAITNVPEGCIGWAKFKIENEDGTYEDGQTVKICLLRNSLKDGLVWEGHLIPIEGRTINYDGTPVQCYMTMNDAFILFNDGEKGFKK